MASLMDRPNKDPLAIAVAVVSLVVQLGAVLYWGGKLTQRVDDIEAHVTLLSQYTSRNTEKTSAHDVSIAVINSQLTEIKDTVNRIDVNTKKQPH